MPLIESGLAVDSTGVYWDDGNLMKTPLAGGASTMIAAGLNATAIALDGARIYWTDADAGTVMAIAK